MISILNDNFHDICFIFCRYGPVLTRTPIVYSHIPPEEGSSTFHQNVQEPTGIMILEDLGGRMSRTVSVGCPGKPGRLG